MTAESTDETKSGDQSEANRRRHATYRYGLLLLMLLATFVFVGVAPQGHWATFLILVLESATLLVALAASDARQGAFVFASVVIVLALAASVSELIFNKGDRMLATTAVVCALLVVVAPFSLIRGVVKRRKLDTRTVLAALCLYVMLGLFFAFIFQVIQSADAHPFFTQGRTGNPSEFMYFSFATLTTVGYGDFTAAFNGGRTLSVFEAMVGQVYLVTVVALLVSNLGPAMLAQRQVRTGANAPATGDDPAAHEHRSAIDGDDRTAS